MFDLLLNYAYKGLVYRRDSDFTSSFSYKTHQITLIALLAFISAQYVRPSIPSLTEVPKSLPIIHFFSTLVSLSLVVTFLLELTAMAPITRLKVFRVELTKVFMTIVFFYAISLFFTTWIRSCSSVVKKVVAFREGKLRQ